MPERQQAPKKLRNNPVAVLIYDVIMNERLNRIYLAKELFRQMDPAMNRLLRKAIASTQLREQKRMIDALATDTVAYKENKDGTVTVTYKKEAWESLTRMLDQFTQQDKLAALDTAMQARSDANEAKESPFKKEVKNKSRKGENDAEPSN